MCTIKRGRNNISVTEHYQGGLDTQLGIHHPLELHHLALLQPFVLWIWPNDPKTNAKNHWRSYKMQRTVIPTGYFPRNNYWHTANRLGWVQIILQTAPWLLMIRSSRIYWGTWILIRKERKANSPTLYHRIYFQIDPKQ